MRIYESEGRTALTFYAENTKDKVRLGILIAKLNYENCGYHLEEEEGRVTIDKFNFIHFLTER